MNDCGRKTQLIWYCLFNILLLGHFQGIKKVFLMQACLFQVNFMPIREEQASILQTVLWMTVYSEDHIIRIFGRRMSFLFFDVTGSFLNCNIKSSKWLQSRLSSQFSSPQNNPCRCRKWGLHIFCT